MNTSERRAPRRILIRVRAPAFGVVILLVAAGGRPAAAQGAPRLSPPTIRLGDLYERVQGDNPRANAARALARAAEARVPGASRPPDPQLQLGAMNYTVPGLSPMATLGMTQIQLMQMLPLGGKLTLSGRIAGAEASAAVERALELAWEVRAEAAMSFYDLYATDRRLDVTRKTLRLLHDIEKTAAAMYRVGDGRQADVLRAQVEIAKMIADTLHMHAMRSSMIARLNALLDHPADEALGAPALPRFPDTIPAQRWIDSLSSGGRAMIRAGVESVRGAMATVQLARREIWPDLQLGVQYAQRGGEMGAERMASLMIGASIPIFARARQLRMREEATAMTQMAEADLAAMRAETRGRIGEVYAMLVRARRLAQLYRTTVLPQAEAAAASALAAYRVGGVDFMTVLDDRMTVNEYRQELSGLEADEGKAWAELEMLTGRELIDSHSVVAMPEGGDR
jgi:cobalt-zinc-cadmium efflux system outer membrane protein